MTKSQLLDAISACVFAFVVSSAHAVSYSIIDLGTLGGIVSQGFGINDSGQVTGLSTNQSLFDGNSVYHAFLYDGSTMRDLGTLGGTYSSGSGINDSGQVTGWSDTTVGSSTSRAFLYDGNTMKDLGTLGGAQSTGKDINNSGQVTGAGDLTGDSAQHAFLFDGSTMRDLGTLGGTYSSGWGINDSGQVTGISNLTGNNAENAFLFDGTSMQPLGTLGGTRSGGFGISDNGQVTGASQTAGDSAYHAFLYDGSTMQDLGTLGGSDSFGIGINNSGQVVGKSWTTSALRAFLYDGTSMQDLCALVDCVAAGWDYFAEANAINDNGDITGWGGINGENHAFLVQVSAALPTIFSSVLPSSRSVQVGSPATAFSTIINPSGATATNCSLSPVTSLPADFLYQTTDPLTNALTGTPNTPVTIAPEGSQSFVIAFTPTEAFSPTEVELLFDCSNTDTAPTFVGLNTLLLSASDTPTPDIVALAATLSGDGIANIDGIPGTGAFAVAIANVGATGNITASVDTGGANLPVSVSMCETNPATGLCISSVQSSVVTTIESKETAAFAIFLTSSGNVPFDPANNRIFVRFQDTGGVTRGSTSVAVQTL